MFHELLSRKVARFSVKIVAKKSISIEKVEKIETYRKKEKNREVDQLIGFSIINYHHEADNTNFRIS